MAIRHERFVETNPDAILIEDANTVQEKSNTHFMGFAHVLDYSEENAVKLLNEDRKSSLILDQAWYKAEEELKNFKIDPSDKLTELSKECKLAVLAYTLESPNLYYYFNQSSREVTNFIVWEDFPYKGLWLLLQKALFSPAADYDEPFYVYRGCKAEFTVNIGSKIMFQQFVSTTTNKKIAEDYAASGSGTMFFIEVSVALGIQKLSAFAEEEEYLLAPNHGYEVVDLKQNGKVREIYLKSLDISFLI